jgi:Putative addiction module component
MASGFWKGWGVETIRIFTPHFETCGKLRNRQSVQRTAMTTKLETIQAEALRLSAADRAKLLDRVMVSLDADAAAEAAWDELANQRESELETGQAQAVPLDLVIARLEARFPG